jgi:signal peptidase I
MEPTLQPGDTVLVDRTTQVHRGDVIVEQQPSIGPGYYVRRVIGLPGDHVACCDAHGQITVNGKPLNETYLYPGEPASRVRFHVTVPRGKLWLLGDNRSVALDSQSYGPVEVRVVGRVFTIIRGGHSIYLQTPQTFAADGLAPAGTPVPPGLIAIVVGSVALLLLVALSIFGTVRYVIRRHRRAPARQHEVPQESR